MTGAHGIAQLVDRHEGMVPVSEIHGEIDASNVDDVLTHVVAQVPLAAPGIVVDLTETRYLDSAGVRFLFELARRLRARRQELRVVVPTSGVVRRVLVLTALGEVVALDTDVLEAVKMVQSH